MKWKNKDLHASAIRFERFVQGLIADIEQAWEGAGYPVKTETISLGRSECDGFYVWIDFTPDAEYLKVLPLGEPMGEGYKLLNKTCSELGFSGSELQVSSERNPEYRVTGARYWGTGA
uniref:Uncharacterized protein n=1 Tax=uncultured prokaryote TaxID=198431 RepID=A0A0H5PWG8_9ZZZZ|nr:hypothetical protein [uncultured prokaryote]